MSLYGARLSGFGEDSKSFARPCKRRVFPRHCLSRPLTLSLSFYVPPARVHFPAARVLVGVVATSMISAVDALLHIVYPAVTRSPAVTGDET